MTLEPISGTGAARSIDRMLGRGPRRPADCSVCHGQISLPSVLFFSMTLVLLVYVSLKKKLCIFHNLKQFQGILNIND